MIIDSHGTLFFTSSVLRGIRSVSVEYDYGTKTLAPVFDSGDGSMYRRVTLKTTHPAGRISERVSRNPGGGANTTKCASRRLRLPHCREKTPSNSPQRGCGVVPCGVVRCVLILQLQPTPSFYKAESRTGLPVVAYTSIPVIKDTYVCPIGPLARGNYFPM